MGNQGWKDEAWRKAKAKMDRMSGPYKAKALVEAIKNQGLTVAEAIGRVVDDRVGNDATEDQVRDLAASLAWMFDVKPERFVMLWREVRDRR